MKKAALHIILLLSLLSSFLSHTFAPAQGTERGNIQKTGRVAFATAILIDSNDLLYKHDFLNDLDDFEESDCDDHGSSFNDKLISDALVQWNEIPALLSHPSFCGTIYTTVHFSRIPRYDYLALRVLRI